MKYHFPDISKNIHHKLRSHRREAMGPKIPRLTIWSTMYDHDAKFRARVDIWLAIVFSLITAMFLTYCALRIIYSAADYLAVNIKYVHTLVLFTGIILLIMCATAIVVIFRKQK